jgi:4'-phosphopantetheinyl transferase
MRLLLARLRLDHDARTLEVAASLATDEERARAARFVRVEDRARHLLGRALARRLLSARLGVAARTLSFETDARGKPRLAAPGAPSFNVSHSGDWVVCAVADGEASVGTDVQRLEPGMIRPDDYGRVFGPCERAAIGGAGDADARIAAFGRAWARKEAILKATGVGIATALETLDIVDGPDGPGWGVPGDRELAAALLGRWRLRDVPIDAMHACAVAWRGGDGTVEVTDVDTPALADA